MSVRSRFLLLRGEDHPMRSAHTRAVSELRRATLHMDARLVVSLNRRVESAGKEAKPGLPPSQLRLLLRAPLWGQGPFPPGDAVAPRGHGHRAGGGDWFTTRAP